MRPRIKGKGNLCSRATPEGKYYQGEQERLRKKFESGNIDHKELWAYCLLTHSSRKPHFTVNGELSIDVPVSKDKFKTITVWGKELKIRIEDYNIYCAELNLI